MLEGVVVIDLSRILAGPFAAQALAQLGADVIKVEPPEGDPSRGIGPFIGSRSLYFSSLNTGKRGVVIDLKTAEGKARLDLLLDRADIVIENFRPAAADRLGLDADAALATRPELVWVSIPAFRASSGRSDDPGYDLIAQAESGIMSVTGESGGPPLRAGVAIGDLSTGLWAAIAALGGYIRRIRTGRGSRVEVPLVDATMTLLSYVGTSATATGEEPGPVGSGHHTLLPYGAFPTLDGWLAIAVIGDKFWIRLADALELSPVDGLETNAARAAASDAVNRMVSVALAGMTTESAIERLQRADVPHAPIRSVIDAMTYPYGADAVESIETESGSYHVVRAPTGEHLPLRPAPKLGQHDSEVFDAKPRR
ncbi:MAG: CoA transferase [Acidimicrobiia bacterium]|nr:CoA transferase [Acidimicrobiia bacterium]NNC43010.1 CoA transferase [Acidimicrobiia bacterium]